MRRILAVAGMAIIVLGALGHAHGAVPRQRAAPRPSVASTYRSPLPLPLHVVRAFLAPVTRYGPGHRGVDLDARSSRRVRAAAAGTVTFAGPVAGRGVVVISHADGIRTEYEPVQPAIATGTVVGLGEVIGTVTGLHPGCRSSCLHWGARRGSDYIDPLTLLAPLGPVRLLPWPAIGRNATASRTIAHARG